MLFQASLLRDNPCGSECFLGLWLCCDACILLDLQQQLCCLVFSLAACLRFCSSFDAVSRLPSVPCSGCPQPLCVLASWWVFASASAWAGWVVAWRKGVRGGLGLEGVGAVMRGSEAEWQGEEGSMILDSSGGCQDVSRDVQDFDWARQLLGASGVVGGGLGYSFSPSALLASQRHVVTNESSPSLQHERVGLPPPATTDNSIFFPFCISTHASG